MDVFISYSRKDTAIADRVCEAFDRAGISYFIDRQGIGGGMEFPDVLAEAIAECRVFLFLASANSYASKFTNSEIVFAFNEKEKQSIIPYLIDDSAMPRGLRFVFSGINWRTLREHPVEPVLVNDVLQLLGRPAGVRGGSAKPDRDFVETAAGLDMKMVRVEGGEFLMGGTPEQGPDIKSSEKVIRRVNLDSYYIGECAVTQGQWKRVMGTSVQQQAEKAGLLAKYGVGSGVGSDYPMYYVSWEEAQTFCQELSRITGRNYCLPTEAQWEYAARGGINSDGTKYSGSNDIDAVAWYGGNGNRSTHPVKSKRPNSLGLYDMSGNVNEWCSDWYDSSYNVNDTNNPAGPPLGWTRVLRGGCWDNSAGNCRVSSRNSFGPGERFYYNGFRVALLP